MELGDVQRRLLIDVSKTLFTGLTVVIHVMLEFCSTSTFEQAKNDAEEFFTVQLHPVSRSASFRSSQALLLSLTAKSSINLLKPTGHVVNQQF